MFQEIADALHGLFLPIDELIDSLTIIDRVNKNVMIYSSLTYGLEPEPMNYKRINHAQLQDCQYYFIINSELEDGEYFEDVTILDGQKTYIFMYSTSFLFTTSEIDSPIDVMFKTIHYIMSRHILILSLSVPYKKILVSEVSKKKQRGTSTFGLNRTLILSELVLFVNWVYQNFNGATDDILIPKIIDTLRNNKDILPEYLSECTELVIKEILSLIRGSISIEDILDNSYAATPDSELMKELMRITHEQESNDERIDDQE